MEQRLDQLWAALRHKDREVLDLVARLEACERAVNRERMRDVRAAASAKAPSPVPAGASGEPEDPVGKLNRRIADAMRAGGY